MAFCATRSSNGCAATAEVNADIMMNTSFNVRRGERIDSEYAAPGYEHLPEDLQEEGVSKSFYQGYEAVVRAIATVLQGEDRAGLPLVANVRGAMTSDAYSSGVEALHALDDVVYSAMEASPLGDNTWDRIQTESMRPCPGARTTWTSPVWRSG